MVAATPKQGPKARSTAAEVKLRVDTVYGLLCEGNSRQKILQFSAETWGLSENQTDRYLKDAREHLEADCQLSRQAFMAEALAGYREIRSAAFRRGQLMASLKALDSMVALVGLDAR